MDYFILGAKMKEAHFIIALKEVFLMHDFINRFPILMKMSFALNYVNHIISLTTMVLIASHVILTVKLAPKLLISVFLAMKIDIFMKINAIRFVRMEQNH